MICYFIYQMSFKIDLHHQDYFPAFFAAPTDDQLAPVRNSVNLYNERMQKKIPAEVHFYARVDRVSMEVLLTHGHRGLLNG